MARISEIFASSQSVYNNKALQFAKTHTLTRAAKDFHTKHKAKAGHRRE